MRCLSYTGSQPVRLHQGARFPEALLFRSVPWLAKKECICGCRLAVRTRMHSARHAVRRHHRPAQTLGAPPMFHPLWQATLPFFASVCTSVKWGIVPTPSQGYLGEMRRLHKQTLNKHSYDQAFTSLRPRFVILQRKVTIVFQVRSLASCQFPVRSVQRPLHSHKRRFHSRLGCPPLTEMPFLILVD